jgi:colanic acid biosynthesis protein WcaH
MFLSENDFSKGVDLLPLISIDFCILNDQDKLLLVKRNCRPARDYLFTPGGRVRKNEKFFNAMQRISHDELGLSLKKSDGLIQMGIWDHFYQDSAFSNDISTHYINIPYFFKLTNKIQKQVKIKFGENCQHDYFEWKHITECMIDKKIHKYAKEYAKHVYNNYIL